MQEKQNRDILVREKHIQVLHFRHFARYYQTNTCLRIVQLHLQENGCPCSATEFLYSPLYLGRLEISRLAKLPYLVEKQREARSTLLLVTFCLSSPVISRLHDATRSSSMVLEPTESCNCTLPLSQFEVITLLTLLYLLTASLL